MAYDEGPRPAGRNNQAWTWIIIAAIVIVVALILFWFFFRPGQEVIAPGNGVDVVEPADEDVDAVPATVEEGAWISPGLRYVTVDGVGVMAA